MKHGVKHDDHGSWTYHLKSFIIDLWHILLAGIGYAKTSAFFPVDIQLAVSFLQQVTRSHRTVSSQNHRYHHAWASSKMVLASCTLHHCTETFQQTTPSICKVAVFSTKHIHNAPPNFIWLPSVLIAGGRLQLLQTRLQLGQPLLWEVDRSTAEAEGGGCLAQTDVTRNLFQQSICIRHPLSRYIYIFTCMLLFFQNLRKLWRFMSVPNVSLEFSRLHKAFCIEP